MRTDRRIRPGNAVVFIAVAMMIGVAASSDHMPGRTTTGTSGQRPKLRVSDRQAMAAWLACFSEAAKELSGKRLSTKLVAGACHARHATPAAAMQSCLGTPAITFSPSRQLDVAIMLMNLPPPTAII